MPDPAPIDVDHQGEFGAGSLAALAALLVDLAEQGPTTEDSK